MVKVRAGFGLGTSTALNAAGLDTVVDTLEQLGFDSLWFSERIGANVPDPLVAMAYAAGRTTAIKFGMSVMVLPGRNPIVLAKQLATLDQLSRGRLLPAFGLGVADPHEQQAFGVQRNERARWFDEALAVLRGAWAEGTLTHHGERFDYDELRVLPKPTRKRLEVWLGGIAPSELRRVGRLADGWLPSFVTPDDAARGREVIERELAIHGRTIEDDHYGVLIPYTLGEVPEAMLTGLARRRPDLDDPSSIIPGSLEALAALIDAFIAVGTSKFVVVPLVESSTPDGWIAHLTALAAVTPGTGS